MQSKNLIGQTLLDRFRVDAFLGAGGMGAVYQVWDLQRSVYLAMKTLHADLADDPAAYRRFKREAENLKNLSHPHIVPFYGIYESEPQGLIFLLQGFINGPSLKEMLRERGGRPMEIGEALEILRVLCAALGYAHALGVVHLDVKPGNVLFDGAGAAYLADFGIARQIESTTVSLGPSGTPAYMAPEQIRGDPLSPATDIYALGVMLFEMLTGRRPFLGDEPELEAYQAGGAPAHAADGVRAAHLLLAPPDPRAFNPAIPPGLSEVVLRALAKDPAQRFASTRDMFVAAAAGAGEGGAPREPWQAAPRQDEDWDATFDGAATPRPPAFPEPVPAPYTRPRSRLTESRWRACLLLAALAVGGLALGGLVGAALFSPAGLLGQRAVVSTAETPPGEAAGGATPTAPGEPTGAAETAASPPTAPPEATVEPAGETPPAAVEEDRRVSARDGMLQLFVPAGSFVMGTDDSPWFFLGPEHTVTLDAFWIDQTQVTNAMYARFVAETGYVTETERRGAGWVFNGEEFIETQGADWRHPRGPDSSIDGMDSYPVVQVTWEDASAYCAWAGRRLPTEAEWEKAARGEDGRTFPWGEGIDCTRANYATRAGGGYCVGGLTPVGAYPAGASPYGALDMAGNAWDWTSDWWQNDYYTVSPAENPTGPPSGDRKAQRGGAWYSFDLQAQSAYRYPHVPSDAYDSVSFRCAESE